MDRIAAARSRVETVKAEIDSPARRLPCIQCRYYELVCTHPAVGRFKINPETGKGKLIPEFAEVARSEAGACGPEGALFDSRSAPAVAIISVLAHPLARWIVGLGLIFVVSGALGY